MRVLIVAVTEKEINLALEQTQNVVKIGTGLYRGNWGNLEIEYLISGIGLVALTHRVSLHLAKNNFDLAINVGMAGTFRDNFGAGTVLNVTKEQFADLGIDDNGEFRSLFEIAYLDKNSHPFTSGVLINNFDSGKYSKIASLPKVSAITVSKSSGEQGDIVKKWMKFQPDIESMEGAAFFYVCMSMGQPCLQLRSVAYVVAPRDTKLWNIPIAIMSLSECIAAVLNELNDTN